MVYTVAKLAKISGVSIRTLHWYDEIGLLKPAYHGANGYRDTMKKGSCCSCSKFCSLRN
ncbi:MULTISPECIES: MerR family DNA-binding transcriptional regulator [Candidatus Rhabdochlamydia]|uniref:MerR family DNA-binding transcriptional regulator n=1 Tax=Candidatus Rhabdochlamydia TaxID=292833 RepID=UPI001BFC2DD5